MIELDPPLSSVSERTQERFGIIRDYLTQYEPNEFVRRDIGHKVVGAIVGPCSVGKSHVIDEVVRLHPEVGKVRTFTTRDPRPDDTPDTISHLPWDERHIKRICNTIEAGDAVQFVFHPMTGDIYGTTLDSYPSEYNILPALSTSIADFEHLPFRAFRSVGLIAAPESWEEWFTAREFASAADRTKRLAEAAQSLEWMLAHPQVAIIENVAGDPTQAAEALYAFITAPGRPTPTREEHIAHELLARIRSMS